MADNAVKGTRPITATNTPFNALSYMIETQVKGLINTALPVRIDSVDGNGVGPTGYVSVTPLITQKDGDGNSIEPQQIPRLPYTRVQGGKAALIIDPQPGDIGIAIFAQQDISSLTTGTTTPVTPGSFRSFDVSDGMYIGGILNSEPQVYIELKNDNTAKIYASSSITLESDNVTLNATMTTVNGDMTINGQLMTTGDQIGEGISLKNHKHTGVQTGGDETGPPI